MQRLLRLSASAVITIYSDNAIADSLKGTYGSTGIETCLIASSGFNTSRQALGTTYSVSIAAEAVATFNRDGTSRSRKNGTTIVPPPTVGFLPGASSSQNGASFTYTVTDETFTLRTVPGINVGKVLTGPRADRPSPLWALRTVPVSFRPTAATSPHPF
jgi:hypothetical protein